MSSFWLCSYSKTHASSSNLGHTRPRRPTDLTLSDVSPFPPLPTSHTEPCKAGKGKDPDIANSTYLFVGPAARHGLLEELLSTDCPPSADDCDAVLMTLRNKVFFCFVNVGVKTIFERGKLVVESKLESASRARAFFPGTLCCSHLGHRSRGRL